MDLALLRLVNAERRARRAVVVAAELGGGAGRLVKEGEQAEGALGEAVAEAFRTGRSGIATVGAQEFFLTAHLPEPRLVVIGAVHISQALAPMGQAAGFHVEIVDPRTAFASAERFPGHPPLAEWPEDALGRAPLDRHCALAALTHDPKIDDYPLRSALESGCFYVGALGSRKTHAKRLERLAQAGLSPNELARIHAPIGLDIGASSPAEIAVSILAQVIAAYRGRDRQA